jgi:hypothetical protein
MMKKVIISTLLAMISSTLAFGQDWSDVWEFNDEAGTPLNLAANTGTSGMLKFDQRDPDAGPPTGGATDGSGLFVVEGDTSQSFRSSDTTGYGGVLSAEWVITGWELDSKDVNQSQSFRSAGIRMRDNDAGINIIHFQLNQQGSGNVRIRYSWDGEGNWAVIADGLEQVSSTVYTVGITLDKATGAFTITLNGSEAGTGTAAGAAGVNRFNLYSQGQYQAAPYDQDFVKYDSLKFNATEVAAPTWAGYAIDELGWVDTFPWIGYINVIEGDWVWVLNLQKYIYLPESFVSEAGSWGYVPD